MSEISRGNSGIVDGLAGPRRQGQSHVHGLSTSRTDQARGLVTGPFPVDAEIGQHLGREAGAFEDQSQQEMFGSDEIMAHSLRLALGQRNSRAGALSHSLKRRMSEGTERMNRLPHGLDHAPPAPEPAGTT